MKAFFTLIQDASFSQGVRALIQSTGIGKLRPNIVMLGFKRDWIDCDRKEVVEYFKAIQYVDFFLNSVCLISFFFFF